ncbi:MAG TPA: XRE family transcriptional regulator [Cyanobacteria bacterium UBA8553]|nr:XRE family transcriptional regulator [Cyanobacteria bacterium UBA8553]HAJ58930.1 XRE family transcriptional regulator [Cyanobacteria bacterium UBA8543]
MEKKNKSNSEESESPLKKLREEAGFSQQELAYRIGVGVTTISRWERGVSEAMLTVPQMKALCRELGKSIEELPDEFGPPKRESEGEG